MLNPFPLHLRAALRVKIISLADEARTIRREERRARDRARWLRAQVRKDGAGPEAAARQTASLGFLRAHRVDVVREEARAALLAYAFLRGRTRASVERREPPAAVIGRALGISRRFGVRLIADVDFAAWAAATDPVGAEVTATS